MATSGRFDPVPAARYVAAAAGLFVLIVWIT
jgi:hypothetical protein